VHQHELQALHAMTAASIVAMLNKLADLLDRSDWSDEQAAQLQQRKAVSFAAMITSLSTFSDADATSLLDVSSEALGSAAWLVNDATTDRLVAAANIEIVETSKKTQTLTNLTNYLTQDDWSARLTTGSSYSTWESCISDRLQGLGVFSPHEQTVKAAVSLLTWLKQQSGGRVTSDNSYGMATDFKRTFPKKRENARYISGMTLYPTDPSSLPTAVFANGYAADDPPISRNIAELAQISQHIVKVRRRHAHDGGSSGGSSAPADAIVPFTRGTSAVDLHAIVRRVVEQTRDASHRGMSHRGMKRCAPLDDENLLDGFVDFRSSNQRRGVAATACGYRTPSASSHEAYESDGGGESADDGRNHTPTNVNMSRHLVPRGRDARPSPQSQTRGSGRGLDVASGGVVPSLHARPYGARNCSTPSVSRKPTSAYVDDADANEYTPIAPSRAAKPSCAHHVDPKHTGMDAEEYEQQAFDRLTANSEQKKEEAADKRKAEKVVKDAEKDAAKLAKEAEKEAAKLAKAEEKEAANIARNAAVASAAASTAASAAASSAAAPPPKRSRLNIKTTAPTIAPPAPRVQSTRAVRLSDEAKAALTVQVRALDFSHFTRRGAALAATSKGAFTSTAYDSVMSLTKSKPLAKAAYAAAAAVYDLSAEG
jgi:hypothetical protein